MRNYDLPRRDFLKLGAAGLAAAGLAGIAGCVSDPNVLPPLALSPNPVNAHNRVLSHSVHLPVKRGSEQALRERLGARVLENPAPGVHYARAAILGQRHLGPKGAGQEQLMLGIIYDQRVETALNFLVANGSALDEVLKHCDGYSAGTALDPARLHAYLQRSPYLSDDKLFFTAYDTAESEVLSCLAAQDNFLALLEAAGTASDETLPYLVDRFLTAGVPAAEIDEGGRPIHAPGGLPFRPHVTNTLTMVQPLMQGTFDPARVVPGSSSRLEKVERLLGPHFEKSYRGVFDFILDEGEFAVKDLREHPLAQLHTLHFARIAVIEGDRMLFSSVYDGDFTQYVLDFGSRVADQIDFIWGLTEGYPRAGCRDVKRFIDWIHTGQVDVEVFYSARRNITLLRIQKASELRTRLATFARALPAEGARLRAMLKAFVRENQALIG